MSRLRRPILRSRFLFVTTNLQKISRVFGIDDSTFWRSRWAAVASACRFLSAYCFMRDHLHAIVFPHEQTTISDMLRSLRREQRRGRQPARTLTGAPLSKRDSRS